MITVERSPANAAWPEDFPDRAALAAMIQRALETTLALDGLAEVAPSLQVNAIIMDDAEIAAVNAEHRGKDAPTDVLSFPMFDFPPGPGTSVVSPEEFSELLAAWPVLSDFVIPGEPGAELPQEPTRPSIVLGDLMISHETCRRQAAEIGHSVLDELQRLFVHGLLHLLGYDHEASEEDEIRMRTREDRVLQALG